MVLPWRLWLLPWGVLLLSACTANDHSIYRSRQLSEAGSTVITIDAKQRSILANNAIYNLDGTVNKLATRRFCSEPSPDAYTVMAQAFGAGGSLSKSADPASLQAAVNLAYNSAEQGSNISRTQTINMLRELMFRTCERYLSGGYDALELSVQAIRDQRLMVSILAIEQLTGAVTPRPVIIGASGGGTAGASGDAIVALDNARKSKERAEGAYTDAQSAYDAKNGTDKICDPLIGKKEESAENDDQKKDIITCNKLSTEKVDASEDRAKKTVAYLELSNLARAGGVGVYTNIMPVASQGGMDVADPIATEKVTATVQRIVELNFSDSTETQMLCIKVVQGKLGDGNLVNQCLGSGPIKCLR